MCLKKCKGLLRASLCLAIGYLEASDKRPEQYEKCQGVVSSYLNNNGMNFDFTAKNNNTVVRNIVKCAEDVVFGTNNINEALEKLSNKLGIDINY